MKNSSIVSDTGPLISLEKLKDGYGFIGKLYHRIIVPKIVVKELYRGCFSSWHDYKKYYKITDLIKVMKQSSTGFLEEITHLDEGEKQAIQLAFKQNLPLLIEEESGRRVAQNLGLEFSGIAGQIIKAYRQKLILGSEAEQKLTELSQSGRIGKKLYKGLLEVIKKEI